MKKLLVIALSLVLALALSACGTDTPADTSSPSALAGLATVIEIEAKTEAFNHAAIKETDVTGLKIELDNDDGILSYEIEFFVGTDKYEYDINAKTGEILKAEKNDKVVLGATDTNLVGEESAKAIALNHAALKAENITRYKIELDKDDGVLSYEIEFFVGTDEYEYDIDAKTGKILTAEKNDVSTLSMPEVNLMGEAKAKSTALNHAGLKAENITRYKAELDRDNGVFLYEIEFVSGGYEYDYEINAVSGAIIKSEKEIAD